MPFEITNQDPVTLVNFLIADAKIHYPTKSMLILGTDEFSDGTTFPFSLLIEDHFEGEDEERHFVTDFSDFYATWTQHSQLYDLVKTKRGLTGSYSNTGEPQ